MCAGAGGQSFRWLGGRFETKAKGPIMHRDHGFRAQFEKRLDRLLRVHVHFATGWRLVSADRQQSDVDLVTVADFLEAGKISAVAAMKNGAAIHHDDEPAKGAMQIGQKSRAPVMARCKGDFQRAKLDRLPVIELVHDMEPKIVD